jgi:hypothetical protein
MTTPWPVKLASPCSCTHMTLSPSMQSGVVEDEDMRLRRAYCFARAFPAATELTASTASDQHSMRMEPQARTKV